MSPGRPPLRSSEGRSPDDLVARDGSSLATSVSLRLETDSANDPRLESQVLEDQIGVAVPERPTQATRQPLWKPLVLLLVAVVSVSLAVSLTVMQQWVLAALSWTVVVGAWVWLSAKLRRLAAQPLFEDDQRNP